MAPPHSQTLGVIVKDLDNSVLEGATVTVSKGSDSLDSQTSNSSGECIFNIGNFSSWSEGDEVSILAEKTGVGTKTQEITLTDRPRTLNIQLEQTAEFIVGLYEETNTYPLNFAMLLDFQGNKITDVNPLPVSSETKLKEPAQVNTYDSNKRLSTETITVNGIQYRRTFTYTGNNFQFTSRSAWQRV